MLDLWIKGGELVDGSGGEVRVADVGVSGGKVVAVGRVEGPAHRTLEAEGAWVTPGFVDLHTHYDLCLDWGGLTEHCLRQGITSVIGGNCGLGSPDVAAVLARARRAELGVHFGVLAPLGPVRSRVVPRHEGRAASPEELPRVVAALSEALDAGALGVSWGPYHENTLIGPQELQACLREAARRGRPYCVHRRSEGVGGLAATVEALEQARECGVALQISHLKSAGRQNWGELEAVLSRIEAARREQDVSADVYPYDASLTYLSAVLPNELKAAGRLHELLNTREGRRQARAGIEGWFVERMGPGSIVLLVPSLPQVARGSTLTEACAALELSDPVEAALKLIEADPRATGGWAIYREMMNPEQVETILDLPWVAVASDAVPEEEEGSSTRLSAHPRVYSCFSRALTRALKRGGTRGLADAVRRATAFPAQRFGLKRGRIQVGAPADLVLLRDPDAGGDYSEPERYPQGVETVLVSGEVAFTEGEVVARRGGLLGY